MRIRTRFAAVATMTMVAAIPMMTVAVSTASAAPVGVYFCYYEEHITTIGTDVPYVVPASVTTQPYKCPPGSIQITVV